MLFKFLQYIVETWKAIFIDKACKFIKWMIHENHPVTVFNQSHLDKIVVNKFGSSLLKLRLWRRLRRFIIQLALLKNDFWHIFRGLIYTRFLHLAILFLDIRFEWVWRPYIPLEHGSIVTPFKQGVTRYLVKLKYNIY